MKKSKVLIILAGILIISVFATVIAFNLSRQVEEVRILDMHITVGDVNAFNITKGAKAIEFGIVTPGGAGVRWIDISHPKDIPLKVTLESYGDVGDILGVSENEFWVQPGEVRRVKLTARGEEEWSEGDYFGELKIVFTTK